MRCFYVLVFVGYCQLALGQSLSSPQNSFNKNFTFTVFHTFNYEYKDPLRPVNEETFDQTGAIQNDFRMMLPEEFQDALRKTNVQLPGGNIQKPGIEKSRELQFGPTITERFLPAMPLGEQITQRNEVNQLRKSRQGDELVGTKSRKNQISVKQNKTSTTPTVYATNCTYGFCEEVDNYPSDIILRLVKSDGVLDAFFKPRVPDIGQRGSPAFENLCEVDTQRIVPKTANNTYGQSRIVVNLDKYQQIVETQVCRETAMCKFQDYWPIGYVGKCIQQHVEVPLAVLDNDGNKIIVEKFLYPSGCYCACKNE